MCQLREDAERAICSRYNFLQESSEVKVKEKWNSFVDIMFS